MEQNRLDRSVAFSLAFFHFFLHCRQYHRRIDAFMSMQRHGIDGKTSALGLASPIQIRRLHALELFQRRLHPVFVTRCQCIVDQGFNR